MAPVTSWFDQDFLGHRATCPSGPNQRSPTALPLFHVSCQFQAQGLLAGLGTGGPVTGSWGSGLLHSLRSPPTGFKEVGWYPGLEQRYRQAIPNATVPNTTCHLPRPDAFHMLRDPVSGDIPWPGLIFGLTVLATWCWCTDQVMPQPGRPRPPVGWLPAGNWASGCRGLGPVLGPPQGHRQ